MNDNIDVLSLIPDNKHVIVSYLFKYLNNNLLDLMYILIEFLIMFMRCPPPVDNFIGIHILSICAYNVCSTSATGLVVCAFRNSLEGFLATSLINSNSFGSYKNSNNLDHNFEAIIDKLSEFLYSNIS